MQTRFVVPVRNTILILTLLCSYLANSAFADWQAGVAKTNITPKQFMWMAGYGSRLTPADGTLTDLWAKALVLEGDKENRAVLITLDLVGIDRDLSQSICSELERRFELQRHQIAICCSHTHTGPALKNNLAPLHYLIAPEREKKLIEAYSDELVQLVVQAVDEAWNRTEPASLHWGSGTSTFAVNRRENSEAKVPQLRSQGHLKGPIDHSVPVLAVRNADGELRCVLFGYACHATVLSSQVWSGDYPGFAQIEIDKNHPGCTAMFWAGCGADQNPLPRRTVELARHYGRHLANSVDAVLLTSSMEMIEPMLRTSFAEIDLPFGPLPDRKSIQQDTQSKDRYVAARAHFLLSQMANDQPLAPQYPYGIGVWKLGSQVDFVFLGGEVVVDYSLRLKSELRSDRSWIAGYANDVMAYIPSRRVLREGGYEGVGAMVYYGLPTAWAPEVEQLIVDEVHRQIGTEP